MYYWPFTEKGLLTLNYHSNILLHILHWQPGALLLMCLAMPLQCHFGDCITNLFGGEHLHTVS